MNGRNSPSGVAVVVFIAIAGFCLGRFTLDRSERFKVSFGTAHYVVVDNDTGEIREIQVNNRGMRLVFDGKNWLAKPDISP